MKKARLQKRVYENCSLAELRIGEKAVVVQVKNDNTFFRRRIIEMGITSGVIVEIKKFAPLGDPVGIKIRGYELCLRKAELKNILVRVVK